MKKSVVSILALSFLCIGGSVWQADAKQSVTHKACAQACSTQDQATRHSCTKTCQTTCNNKCSSVRAKDAHTNCVTTCAASAVPPVAVTAPTDDSATAS